MVAHLISKLYFCEIAYQLQGDEFKLYVPCVSVCLYRVCFLAYVRGIKFLNSKDPFFFVFFSRAHKCLKYGGCASTQKHSHLKIFNFF